MTLPVVWIPEANEDLLKAWAWYANIRRSLESVSHWRSKPRLRQSRNTHCNSLWSTGGRRRAGVRRFPYGMFFEVQEDRVVVIACFHGRRNPRRWQSR